MNTTETVSDPGRRTRRRFTPAEISSHLEAQAASGQSVRAYCADRGLREAAFYRWRRCARPSPATPRFREVPISAVIGSSWAAEIGWPSGMSLRLGAGADTGWARALIAEVGTRA